MGWLKPATWFDEVDTEAGLNRVVFVVEPRRGNGCWFWGFCKLGPGLRCC